MGDGNKHGRGQRRDHGLSEERGGYQQERSAPRGPPPWKDLTTLMVGDITCAISGFQMERGEWRYSYDLKKLGRDGKPKRHFDPRDSSSLKAAIDQADAWIEEDKRSKGFSNGVKVGA